jgi:hypothetical protein
MKPWGLLVGICGTAFGICGTTSGVCGPALVAGILVLYMFATKNKFEK